VRGWVRLAPYSPDAEVLRAARRWWLLKDPADAGAREVEVLGVRRQGSALVAKWQGCDDPEAAERMKGLRVAVARKDFPELPKGQHYWVDLIGLQVVNRAGRQLGRVTGLRASGAHDLLEIEPETGPAVGSGPGDGRRGPILIPVIDRYIDQIDGGSGAIRVDWDPEWLS
jgi:16S rRNA processing protein RimM